MKLYSMSVKQRKKYIASVKQGRTEKKKVQIAVYCQNLFQGKKKEVTWHDGPGNDL